jgi:hypothetical protein
MRSQALNAVRGDEEKSMSVYAALASNAELILEYGPPDALPDRVIADHVWAAAGVPAQGYALCCGLRQTSCNIQ